MGKLARIQIFKTLLPLALRNKVRGQSNALSQCEPALRTQHHKCRG